VQQGVIIYIKLGKTQLKLLCNQLTNYLGVCDGRDYRHMISTIQLLSSAKGMMTFGGLFLRSVLDF
jgi:hypothetical protein